MCQYLRPDMLRGHEVKKSCLSWGYRTNKLRPSRKSGEVLIVNLQGLGSGLAGLGGAGGALTIGATATATTTTAATTAATARRLTGGTAAELLKADE